MWQGGDLPLEQVGEKKPGGEKREEGRRSENIQLLSRISGDQIVCFRRSKRKSSSINESFAWIQESGVFAKLREVGVLLILDFILGLRAIQMA